MQIVEVYIFWNFSNAVVLQFGASKCILPNDFFYLKHWFEYLTAPCFSFVEHCAWLEAVVRSLSDIRVIKCILLSDREKKSGVNCTRWIYIVFGFELFPHIDSSPSNFDTSIETCLCITLAFFSWTTLWVFIHSLLCKQTADHF